MNRLHTVLFLLFVLLPTAAFSAEPKQVSAQARITAVTLYQDRALTRRSAALPLKQGSYLVSFDALPALIQDDSIRIEGSGTAAATITGMEIKRTYLPGSGEKRVAEIQEELLAIEKKIAGLEARKSGQTAQKSFLESIRVAWSERISKELALGRPTAAELQDAATFIGAGITKIEEQNRDIEFEKKSLKDKSEALRRQQNGATGSTRKEVKRVDVMVDISKDGTLTLDLLAVLPQASWEPAYDVRLGSDARNAALTFNALIRQQTGEDWRNIDLTLSSARPAVGGAPPQLYPWLLALYHPQPVMLGATYASAPAPVARAKKALPMKYAEESISEAARDEAEPAAFQTAQISDEQSSVSFHVPRTLDIPSDGSQHSTVVATEQLPVTLEYQAVPKLSPAVFLSSEIINRAPYPLLPGKVNTFIGTGYTGSSQLAKVAAGEKFTIFFGSDDQLTVKRDELKQHKEAGLFGKNRVSYRYRIEAGNFRKEPLTLLVRDQLPLAGDEEIKISLDEPSLKPEEQKNDGTLLWKVPLKAGEKREITFGITVEYPKDRTITGL